MIYDEEGTREIRLATSGSLVGIVADALDLSPETVGVHVRNLRLASLLSHRGVGKSAAKMTALDAARLLLAAAGSLQAKNSVETVLGFGKLLSVGGLGAATHGEDSVAFTLEHALASELMEVAARWPSPHVLSDAPHNDVRWEPDDRAVQAAPVLQLFTSLGHEPLVRAAVLRRFARAGVREEAAFYFGVGTTPRGMDEASFCRSTGARLTQSRTISEKALVYITRRL